MTIDTIHAELDYDQWAPTLQGVGGIWSKLKQLRAKATDPAGLLAYRNYLERCTNQLKVDAELDEPAVGEFLYGWMAFIKLNTKALSDHISGRSPIGVENWMHKWQPLVYDDYRLALNAWLTRATKRSGERLMETTRTMYDEFEKAVPCESA